MTRVLVVDDVDLYRTALASALNASGVEVVGEAADAEAAVAAAGSLRPDLVILDIMMPGLSGVEVIEKIRAASPGSRVVLLTASESDADLFECIKAGARGYLVKDVRFEDLPRSIEAVMSGGAVISPLMAGKLLDVLGRLLRGQNAAAADGPVLTAREAEVLDLVAEEMTSGQIGEALGISENTVKNHVRNIFDKLGVHSRQEAIDYALRQGLIQR